jgi:hypothetical protein
MIGSITGKVVNLGGGSCGIITEAENFILGDFSVREAKSCDLPQPHVFIPHTEEEQKILGKLFKHHDRFVLESYRSPAFGIVTKEGITLSNPEKGELVTLKKETHRYNLGFRYTIEPNVLIEHSTPKNNFDDFFRSILEKKIASSLGLETEEHKCPDLSVTLFGHNEETLGFLDSSGDAFVFEETVISPVKFDDNNTFFSEFAALTPRSCTGFDYMDLPTEISGITMIGSKYNRYGIACIRPSCKGIFFPSLWKKQGKLVPYLNPLHHAIHFMRETSNYRGKKFERLGSKVISNALAKLLDTALPENQKRQEPREFVDRYPVVVSGDNFMIFRASISNKRYSESEDLDTLIRSQRGIGTVLAFDKEKNQVVSPLIGPLTCGMNICLLTRAEMTVRISDSSLFWNKERIPQVLDAMFDFYADDVETYAKKFHDYEKSHPLSNVLFELGLDVKTFHEFFTLARNRNPSCPFFRV